MKLVGCIDKLDNIIKTRFFFVNPENQEVRDVTMELCEAIEAFNEVARAIRDTGEYSMTIPFDYKYGMAEYSFGCGLSHYLQSDQFSEIEERYANTGNNLSFPLVDCVISMYTPNDVKHILGCKNSFDDKITNALKERFGLVTA